jgi:hypothetical protein
MPASKARLKDLLDELSRAGSGSALSSVRTVGPPQPEARGNMLHRRIQVGYGA